MAVGQVNSIDNLCKYRARRIVLLLTSRTTSNSFHLLYDLCWKQLVLTPTLRSLRIYVSLSLSVFLTAVSSSSMLLGKMFRNTAHTEPVNRCQNGSHAYSQCLSSLKKKTADQRTNLSPVTQVHWNVERIQQRSDNTRKMVNNALWIPD